MEGKKGEFTIGRQRDIEHLRHYPLKGEYETLRYMESELGSVFEALMMDFIGERVDERETLDHLNEVINGRKISCFM